MVHSNNSAIFCAFSIAEQFVYLYKHFPSSCNMSESEGVFVDFLLIGPKSCNIRSPAINYCLRTIFLKFCQVFDIGKNRLRELFCSHFIFRLVLENDIVSINCTESKISCIFQDRALRLIYLSGLLATVMTSDSVVSSISRMFLFVSRVTVAVNMRVLAAPLRMLRSRPTSLYAGRKSSPLPQQ
jgi:hypothetical protein